ncbi:cytoplasmic chaperone TorD family protein [[Bacillus] selenitireducens MLS10]|uniref:Cytoplasmic chaperone TorD family protein n=2 Tax=Salisediminibacterium selenitireducens TaxID=85683 RepID=D6Y0L6_BACIE|nr:cytoplasmic chaperone TorD family protein [[Bacillus] selenitireducens MLS10]
MMQQTTVDARPLIEIRMFYYDTARRLFRREPDAELTDALTKVMNSELPFEDEYPAIQEGRVLIAACLNEAVPLDRLHWDYTRMFIGPYKLPAPIWESAYTNKDGLLFQTETREVRLHYLKYAFLPVQYQKEADDHLGLELDFMYRLSEMTKDAWEAGDWLRMKTLLSDQAAFLEEHLRNWLPIFKGLVLESADTDFYRGAVLLLDGLTRFDQDALKELNDTRLS